MCIRDRREMAARADFIQENIPEQLPLKQRMLAEVSRHAAPDVIIASSTSGLTPTDLQRDMVAPQRFCVAHPFNPVYLLPLVELVGGARTGQGTIDAAAKFFTFIGMHPLHLSLIHILSLFGKRLNRFCAPADSFRPSVN